MFKQILFLIAAGMLVVGCGCEEKKEKEVADVVSDAESDVAQDTTETAEDTTETDSAEADVSSADVTEPVDVAQDVTPQD